MLQEFYKYDRGAIVRLVRKYLDEDFFVAFPEWRDKIAVIVVGSTAAGNHDRLSDIDLDIIAPDERTRDLYDIESIREYKKTLLARGEPVQIHKPKTLGDVESVLGDWSKDQELRHYSQAVIVCDPGEKLRSVRKRYRWYPREIFLEKVNWLFAEAVFEFHDRFEVAIKRRDRYFAEASKMLILRLLLNAALMAKRRHPAFDKHVYKEIARLPALRTTRKVIDRLLVERDVNKEAVLLRRVVSLVERMLVAERLIPKKDAAYWMGLRPKHKVQLG